ncbi:LMBR1-like conserved region-containing protein [Tieghemostelium lacteum]|uniref:LMBR1-like conserved region-containing protein n=1 Tax=Tieghemostelium lacteum TaxID=361077 RepID=A0A151Z608_TIELA|nr:LMBR1-like conserved region-containing protein [Tieghemostelium lacteum]|eukprot:KYQ89234.1 LMBR1-like conserved region-containing protein [Tieghemostelium lacteum]
MIEIGLGWASFGLVILILVVFNYIVVKYYSDKHESEKITTVISIIGLTLALLCVMIIPVDILNVSTISNSSGNVTMSQNDIDNRGQSIRIVYYVLYAAIMLCALILIPFAYFYYEEYDENVSAASRTAGACKFTAFFVAFALIILIVGAFIRPDSKPPVENENIKLWIQNEVVNQNAAESAVLFSIACLTVLGFLVWITYTAYGFSAFPIGLIKGYRRVSDDKNDISRDLHKTREKAKYFSSKYASGKKLSRSEESSLSLLKDQERALENRSYKLDQSTRGIRKVLGIFRPFSFIFGFVFLLISLLIIISIVLSVIDKISSSICGSACGFLVTYPNLKNPIDIVLVQLAPYFPLDYFILGALIFYIFFVTLSGIVKIGIRFLWVHMYDFKYRKTMPQGLLIAAMLLMLSILCLNVQILSLAPRYAMFGTQVWYNATSGDVEPCSIEAPSTACTMSQIGVLSSRIQMGTAFFGIIYYYATWVFVGTFLLGAIVALIKRRKSNIEISDSDDEEF